jgi:DNA-binding response OmpR family regulator
MAGSSRKPDQTILVVDDDEEVLSVAVDFLEMAGYKVLSTPDPRHALQLARTQTGPLHLLLTDVVMPFMTGPDLAVKVRSLRPGIKVLFMSAFTSGAMEDHGIQIAPGEPLLVKPFTLPGLSNKVQALLNYQSPFSRPDRR